MNALLEYLRVTKVITEGWLIFEDINFEDCPETEYSAKKFQG